MTPEINGQSSPRHAPSPPYGAERSTTWPEYTPKSNHVVLNDEPHGQNIPEKHAMWFGIRITWPEKAEVFEGNGLKAFQHSGDLGIWDPQDPGNLADIRAETSPDLPYQFHGFFRIQL